MIVAQFLPSERMDMNQNNLIRLTGSDNWNVCKYQVKIFWGSKNLLECTNEDYRQIAKKEKYSDKSLIE